MRIFQCELVNGARSLRTSKLFDSYGIVVTIAGSIPTVEMVDGVTKV